MESIAITAITTLGTLVSIVLTAFVNRRVGKVAADAATSRAQLENDHEEDPELTSNIREDMDNKHSEQMREIRTLGKDIGGIRADIRILHQNDQATNGRLDDHIREGHHHE